MTSRRECILLHSAAQIGAYIVNLKRSVKKTATDWDVGGVCYE